MAFDLQSITSGVQMRPPRIILLGVEKIGKSTFAAGSDRPIFVPIMGEEGIDAIDVPKWPEPCQSIDDLMACLTALYSGQHDYGTVVIDSASALEPLVWGKTCLDNGNAASIEKVNGGYAKGYTEALKYWRQISEALDYLRNQRGMSSILIGHVKVKRFDDPAGDSYDQYQFDIHEKAASLLYRWADVILFCNTKVVVRKEDVGFNRSKGKAIDICGGERYLYTQKRPAHPGGGRGAWGQLPYELPLSWPNLIDAVSAVGNK
jgi:hypothetical protein